MRALVAVIGWPPITITLARLGSPAVRSDRSVIGSSGAQPLVGRVVHWLLQDRCLPLDRESVRIEETPVEIQSDPDGETFFVAPERPEETGYPVPEVAVRVEAIAPVYRRGLAEPKPDRQNRLRIRPRIVKQIVRSATGATGTRVDPRDFHGLLEVMVEADRKAARKAVAGMLEEELRVTTVGDLMKVWSR